MDTPYWEQLQYIGDTRIQALRFDVRSPATIGSSENAIELFDESRIPDGITQSRYPGDAAADSSRPSRCSGLACCTTTGGMQAIATFLKPYLRGARGVLDWFEARLAPSGLLGKLEWWNFADWVDSFEDGEPPTDRWRRVRDPHPAVRARAA